MLDRTNIDTVYIGLINSVHYEYAKRALEKRKSPMSRRISLPPSLVYHKDPSKSTFKVYQMVDFSMKKAGVHLPHYHDRTPLAFFC